MLYGVPVPVVQHSSRPFPSRIQGHFYSLNPHNIAVAITIVCMHQTFTWFQLIQKFSRASHFQKKFN